MVAGLVEPKPSVAGEMITNRWIVRFLKWLHDGPLSRLEYRLWAWSDKVEALRSRIYNRITPPRPKSVMDLMLEQAFRDLYNDYSCIPVEFLKEGKPSEVVRFVYGPIRPMEDK